MKKTYFSEFMLFLAAFFWGTSFIAQRQAMDNLTPLAYLGIRFVLGALLLLPFAIARAKKAFSLAQNPARERRLYLKGCLAAGSVLFVASCLQQYGLVFTTAGKAGFITALYVVLVPLILFLSGRKILAGEAIGAVLAVVGLYLLSFNESMQLSTGDALVLVGAFAWSGHVLALGHFAPKIDAVVLGTGQALVCGLIGLILAVGLGQMPDMTALSDSWVQILWGSVLSVTCGFTLQVVGQRGANPVVAAIILQLEAVIAAVAGWIVLGEVMTGRMIVGALVMLAGFLISQLWTYLTGSGGKPDAGAVPGGPE